MALYIKPCSVETKYRYALTFVICALNLSAPLHAANAAKTLGGMSPEVIAARKAINRDADQRPQFGAAMLNFSAEMQNWIKRVLRSRKTDKPRIIKRKVKTPFKQRDEPMKVFCVTISGLRT